MREKTLFSLRICGWLIIGLLTLEVCARTEDDIRNGAPFFSNYSIDGLYQIDALGKYGRRNSSYLKWHLNEVGYRGPALRTGTYRIVCMGSSETFGLYESPEKEWPRQLESILNVRAGDQHNEVVNVAYPGMSIATTLERLPQILSALHPKMAVIYPSYTPYIEINHPLTPQSVLPPLSQSSTAPVRLSHLELRLSGRVETLMKAVLPETIQHWLRTQEIKRDASGIRVMERLPDQNVQAFKTDLDTLTQELTANKVQVVLVTHANRFGSKPAAADLPVLEDWRKFFPTLKEEGILDMERRMSEAVRQVAAERSVPVVDAASIIVPGRSNFVEFVHFNDAGAKALATIVADQIDSEAMTATAYGASHKNRTP